MVPFTTFFQLKAKILFSIYNFLSSLNATAGLCSKMLACLQTSIHLHQWVLPLSLPRSLFTFCHIKATKSSSIFQLNHHIQQLRGDSLQLREKGSIDKKQFFWMQYTLSGIIFCHSFITLIKFEIKRIFQFWNSCQHFVFTSLEKESPRQMGMRTPKTRLMARCSGWDEELGQNLDLRLAQDRTR